MTPIPLPPAQPLRFFGYPIDVEGMAGTISVAFSDSHDFWAPDLVAVLIEQDLRPVAPGGRYAAWFPVHREDLTWATLQDAIGTRGHLRWQAQNAIDSHLRPWWPRYDVEGRGWPATFEPFRSLVVLGGLLASVRRSAPGRWVEARLPRNRPWRPA